ncbi:MAG TPA: hypothetical protein VKV02_02040 [Acidobacteriaceae bacterium]|nr:hypothetical protein [Acidobacteriaceae bacterium]
MPRLSARSLAAALPTLALALSVVPQGGAQAVRTASKSADISVFGGFEVADPSYGPDHSTGGMVGVDFTRYFHIPVEPSLEIRANFNSNSYVTEHSYLFGLRAALPIRRIKPYVDFLAGPGTILFPLNYSYPSDNSPVYNYGGGIDFPLVRNFALKLDVQGQHWNTGEFTYTPTVGTVGLTYTIPFRPHTRQRDLVR